MGKVPGIVVTSVVAIVCGFLGAVGGVFAFNDQLTGPQGATGLQGPPGEMGPTGQDGADGEDGTDGKNGKDGKRGPRGVAAELPETEPINVGTSACAGSSVEVVTGAVMKDDKLQVTTKSVCVTE